MILRAFSAAALLAVTFTAAAQQPGPRLTEELLVVASRLPSEQSSVGQSVALLERQTIDDIGYAYAGDTVQFVPGVSVHRSGGYGGLTQVRLRGAESNHTLVLIDGVDVSAANTGEFDFSSLLSMGIERIEVLRGPQSSLHGSNAIGGVISIQTAQPADGLGLSGNVETGQDQLRQAALSLTGGSARASGQIGYVRREARFDISANDAVMGPEDDRDVNETLSGQARLELSDALELQLVTRYADRHTDTDGFDFSGGPLQGLPVDDHSYADSEDLTAGAVATWRVLDEAWVNRLSLQATRSELAGPGFGSRSKRDQATLDSALNWDETGAQRTTAFLQYEKESFDNLVPFEASQRATQQRELLGIGIEQRFRVGANGSASATIRHDLNDDFADETTYSLAGSWRMPALATRLHGSWGRAVTNPTFFEQFGFIPASFIGNPDLQPERSIGWDVGLEKQFGNGAVTFDLTYFRADLEDEIQTVFPGVRNASGASRRSGVEADLRWRAWQTGSVRFTYTYTDADEPAGGEVRRPAHVATLLVARDFLDGRLRASASAIYRDDQLDTDFRNFFSNGFVSENTELDGYGLVNAQASYRLSDGIELYLRAENLLDERYESAIGYAAPGRTLLVGLNFALMDARP